MQLVDLLSKVATASAEQSQQIFPFVTLDNYEALATAVRSIMTGGAPFLAVHPKVAAELRQPWEQYTQEPRKLSWVNQSAAYHDYYLQSTTGRRSLATTLELIAGDATESRSSSSGENASNKATWNGLDGTQSTLYRQGTNEEDHDWVVEDMDAAGPFFPLWQQSPTTIENQRDILRSINYNVRDPALQNQPAMNIVQTNGEALFDGSHVWQTRHQPQKSSDAAPETSLLYPIFKTIVPAMTTENNATGSIQQSEDEDVAAVLEMVFLWDFYFERALPSDANSLMVVVSSDGGECQASSLSFAVTGEFVVFVGEGDLHQEGYNHMMVSTMLTHFMEQESSDYYTGVPVNTDHCPWEITVYATQDMEDAFYTMLPLYLVLGGLLIFLWTCAIFMLYDWLVEKRQQKVMAMAIKSDQIVAQLFPANFRDALYRQDSNRKKSKKEELGPPTGDRKDMMAGWNADIVESFKRSVGANLSGANEPMARLYPKCTVFFADIAGFTSWSSARTPAQVFTLLETTWKAFDKVGTNSSCISMECFTSDSQLTRLVPFTRRLHTNIKYLRLKLLVRYFFCGLPLRCLKDATNFNSFSFSGDCYVAVCGLPQPQPKHALLMVKFSRDVLAQMPKLMKSLSKTLGPDTIKLAMRVGIHSGPVTAGVLRGEKAVRLLLLFARSN